MIVERPSAQRGTVDLGWLRSENGFSFGHYHDPAWMGFGPLRVINDDTVAPCGGFAPHRHANMEIVSVVLEGALAHKDSTGTDGVIRAGEVQWMSAGHGIEHSEYNGSDTEPVHFLQVWIQPDRLNAQPAYAQQFFDPDARRARWAMLVSPDGAVLADVYSYTNKPPELYVGGVKATTSPAPEFATYPWLDVPIVRVPARDGAQVPARIFKPANWNGGPAVIFVHGAGYLQNVHRGWSTYFREYMFHHLLMERGYLVLDIDYRGSAGSGRDWRTAIYRHMGGVDLDDHVDAARWLVREHGVDEWHQQRLVPLGEPPVPERPK
jgi:hypothetical protein